MIGLFDSGIGGLTVAREIRRRLPDYPLLYLGDTARTPYGNKSPQVVKSYGLEATRFLVEQGARIIVVACNTVSAVGLAAIKQAYPQVPVFDVINPTIETIIQKQHFKSTTSSSPVKDKKPVCVGVIGTRALTNSGVYQKLLGQYGYKVVAQPAPLLVPLVEEGWLDRPETKRIIKYYLRPLRRAGINILVLACTHYPLLKKLIAPRVGKKVTIIDPAEATAEALVKWLYDNEAEAAKIKEGESRFYVTDYTEQMEKIACRWMGSRINLLKASLG